MTIAMFHDAFPTGNALCDDAASSYMQISAIMKREGLLELFGYKVHLHGLWVRSGLPHCAACPILDTSRSSDFTNTSLASLQDTLVALFPPMCSFDVLHATPS